MLPAPNPLASYERDGYDKMLALAKVLCRLVQQFKAIIIAKYPDSTPILALLVAIESMCALLPEADAEFTALSLNQSTPPSDPTEVPGADPSAPPASAPDLT